MSLTRFVAKPLFRRGLSSPGAQQCRKKFLRYFPRGFQDAQYDDWERGYKWNAHLAWEEMLNHAEYKSLLRAGQFSEIAARAVRLESRTNLLFSFEKMALRDAVKSSVGAKRFAQGLYDFIYGKQQMKTRFENWIDTVAALPRKQTRVLTWPIVTVFGFIARPDEHIFLKPNITRRAAEAYVFEFDYQSRPNWETYASLLQFADVLRRDLRDLRPRDLIDLQSFIWVQASDEYPD